MLRQIIQDQLENCQFADLNNYDSRTNTFLVKKYSKPTYELNHCYLVKLPTSVVNKNDSVLAVNWNNGNSPSVPYLKIYVSKIMGTMIYTDSIGFDFETKQDLNLMWSGWLDSSQLIQIAAL